MQVVPHEMFSKEATKLFPSDPQPYSACQSYSFGVYPVATTVVIVGVVVAVVAIVVAMVVIVVVIVAIISSTDWLVWSQQSFGWP